MNYSHYFIGQMLFLVFIYTFTTKFPQNNIKSSNFRRVSHLKVAKTFPTSCLRYNHFQSCFYFCPGSFKCVSETFVQMQFQKRPWCCRFSSCLHKLPHDDGDAFSSSASFTHSVSAHETIPQSEPPQTFNIESTLLVWTCTVDSSKPQLLSGPGLMLTKVRYSVPSL